MAVSRLLLKRAARLHRQHPQLRRQARAVPGFLFLLLRAAFWTPIIDALDELLGFAMGAEEFPIKQGNPISVSHVEDGIAVDYAVLSHANILP